MPPDKITVELIGGPCCGDRVETLASAMRVQIPYVGWYAYDTGADLVDKVMRWRGPGPMPGITPEGGIDA